MAEVAFWRGIRAVMPSRFATHSRAQEFYFGEDGLLRRQDYTQDIAEGIAGGISAMAA